MSLSEFLICFGNDGLAWDQISLELISPAIISHGGCDVLTAGDLRANEIITSVAERFIDITCISSEECPRSISSGLIIDPIDGTSNFQRGASAYTHAVSYLLNGVLQFFAIYIPIEGKKIYGSVNGVYCNGRLLGLPTAGWGVTVSVMYNTHYSNFDRELVGSVIARLIAAGVNVRISGCPSYDVASYLLGRVDGFVNVKPHKYDATPLAQSLDFLPESKRFSSNYEGALAMIAGGGGAFETLLRGALAKYCFQMEGRL
jgi:fructose-1,6-bisphosphatase/inositol monophosphatase family enzyme